MIALASLSEAIGVLEAAAGALRQAIADHESAGQIAEDILAVDGGFLQGVHGRSPSGLVFGFGSRSP